MASTPLPEKVVLRIQEVCVKKSQPPPDDYARKLLSEIGEEESLKILNTIYYHNKEIRTLNGFIVHLVKNLRSTTTSAPCSPISTQNYIPHYYSPQDNTSEGLKRKRESEFTARRVNLFPSTSSDVAKPVSQISDNDRVSELLDELDKLEFRKAFLILNYLGCSKLEDVVSVDKIRSYQRLSMMAFEVEIWNDFGRVICGEKGRIKKMNWDTGEKYNYHCHVDAEGHYCFKGPFLNKAATLLQKIVGDDNVLIVKVMEQETNNMGTESIKQSPVFNKVQKDGVVIGRRCYRFFVFKDGGKDEKKKDPNSTGIKCYFVCMDRFASLLGKSPDLVTVPEARCLFMHIHKATSVPIYMARFSLILSKTITMDLNYNALQVQVIEDEPCRDENGKIIDDKLILTDGTGFISEDLALKCPHNCFNGCVNNEEDVQASWCFDNQDLQGYFDAVRFPHYFSGLSELKSQGVPPLLIQFRMFHKGKAIKGTVLVNKKLPSNTIQVRKSMLKIEPDELLSHAPSVNSFEVVTTSNKPKDSNLSKNLIALLHFGGVPKKVFMDMLMEALKKPLAVHYKPKAAIRAAVNCDFTEEYIAARMVACGIPLDEPFLQYRLSETAKEEMKSLKGGKLPASGCYYLMGTADPTGTLNSNEVCVILDQGQLSGPLLVYRNPGIHPGDIHVVNARYVETLTDFVGNSKYGIFFPSKGRRSMADEIAGGDYDGDMYWVSMNTEFLKYFRPSEPWNCASNPSSKKDTSLPSSPKTLELELFRLYMKTRFHPNKAMGEAADSWLVYMDRMLTLGDDSADEKAVLREKIDQLIDLYYDALDAPKKGKQVTIKKELKPDLYPHHMGRGEHCTYKSRSILGEIYDFVDDLSAPVKFWKLECFEDEIPMECKESWSAHFSNYRSEITIAIRESKNTAAIFEKYRKVLYGGVNELDESNKAWKDIRLEALAIYHVCYDAAEKENDPRKCGFAWKVAGDALWNIYLKSTGEKPILFMPSVLSQMMK